MNRRDFLARSSVAAATVALLPAAAGATPQAMQELVRSIVGEATVHDGGMTLDVPPLVENGNTVPLTVAVDSAMTEADHVKAIHIVNEKNPQPHVISVKLGPRSGRASVATRIKLADSQRLTALAEMSDGSFRAAYADVVVTLAACVEDLVR